jgi:hypothetical protein
VDSQATKVLHPVCKHCVCVLRMALQRQAGAWERIVGVIAIIVVWFFLESYSISWHKHHLHCQVLSKRASLTLRPISLVHLDQLRTIR